MGCAVHHFLSFTSLASAVQSTDNRIISAPEGAEVKIWDIRGCRVWGIGSVTDDDAARPYTLNPVPCSVVWSPAASLPSGIYLVKATTQDGRTIWKRIVYIR